MKKARACKDCPPSQRPRPAPYPGPRCATHHRDAVKLRREATHEKHVQKTYSLKPGEYEALYAYQNGRCWICQRATGKTKRLAVDHDHVTDEVRGLLCGRCNLDVLGHLRDDPETLLRAYYYLLSPPARLALGRVT